MSKESQSVRTARVSPRNFSEVAEQTGLPYEEIERKYYDTLARSGYRPGSQVYILLDKLTAIYEEKQ